jgi:hypothetical protein
MVGNIFFDEMVPKQLGMWVRYINRGLEEGEVNKKWFGHVEVYEIKKYEVVTFWE